MRDCREYACQVFRMILSNFSNIFVLFYTSRPAQLSSLWNHSSQRNPNTASVCQDFRKNSFHGVSENYNEVRRLDIPKRDRERFYSEKFEFVRSAWFRSGGHPNMWQIWRSDNGQGHGWRLLRSGQSYGCLLLIFGWTRKIQIGSLRHVHLINLLSYILFIRYLLVNF